MKNGEMKTFIAENDFANSFWPSEEEMVKEAEELGYTVEEVNYEYIALSNDDSEDEQYVLYLGHANSTMWVEQIRVMD